MFPPFASFSTLRKSAIAPAAAQGHERSPAPPADQENDITRLESAVQDAEREAALWGWAKEHFYRHLKCRSSQDLTAMLEQQIEHEKAPGTAEVQATPASSTESVSSVTAQMGAMNLGGSATRPTRSAGSQYSTSSREEQDKTAEIAKLKRDLIYFGGKAALWRALKARHAELGFESADALQVQGESAINPRTPSPTLPAQRLRHKLRRRS